MARSKTALVLVQVEPHLRKPILCRVEEVPNQLLECGVLCSSVAAEKQGYLLPTPAHCSLCSP